MLKKWRKLLMQKNSLFHKYLLALLALLIVPTLLGAAMFQVSMRAMEKEVRENSRKTLEQVQKTLDRDLENIRRIAMDLAESEELISFTYNKDDVESLYRLAKLTEKTGKNYNDQNSLIVDSYIYMKENELVLSGSAKYAPQEFYTYIMKMEDWSYDDWILNMDGQYFNDVLSAQVVEFKSGEGKKRVIPYIHSYPMGGSSKGNIVIFLDYDKMISAFEGLYDMEQSCMYYINQRGNVVFTVGDEGLRQENFASLEEGSHSETSGKRSVLVFKQMGEDGKSQYISVEDRKKIRAQTASVRNVVVFYFLLMLLIGAALAAYVAYRGSKPVEELARSLSGGEKEESRRPGGEFAYISNRVKQLVAEKNEVEGIVRRQQPALRKNLLAKILNGNIGDIDDFEEACRTLGLQFAYPSFCVIVFDVQLLGERQSDTELALVKYALQNVTEEVFQEIAAPYIVDNEWSQISMLLNFAPGKQMEEAILRQCCFVQTFMQEQLEADIGIGVGDSGGLNDVSLSFAQAKEALDYRTLSGKEGVIRFCDMAQQSQKYYYSMQQENQLLSSVMMGDEEGMARLLDEIIQMNREASLDMSKCLFFDLMSTALKVMNSEEIDLNAIFPQQSPFEKLVRCSSISELRDTTKVILGEICRYIKSNRTGKREMLGQAILEYVKNNCENNAMSLEMVANAFSLNYTYVSHFFKDYIGENFSNYVTGVKVEKAKEYLQQTDLSISEIATKLGYANSAVLIRNFKKVTDMTPGQFRKMKGK